MRKAGSVEHDAVVKALETGLKIEGPAGMVAVEPKTHHCALDIHLMVVKDQKLTIIDTATQRPPSDTAQYCDLSEEPGRQQAVRGQDLSGRAGRQSAGQSQRKCGMDYAAIVVLEILYMIAFLALISAGLAIVFGMMRVINLAHGEFVMLGGYATIAAAKAGINIYFAMLVISPIVVGAIGLVVERLIVRFLYGRMIDIMLATWGLSLLLIGLVDLIFGNTAVSVPAPIPGYRIGHYQMGGYNLFVIAVAVLLMSGMWFALRYTRVGLVARGAMQGREVVSALGYNPNTIYMLTFTVGAALSGLAGGVMAPLTGTLALDRRCLHRQGLHHGDHRRRRSHRWNAVDRGAVRNR